MFGAGERVKIVRTHEETNIKERRKRTYQAEPYATGAVSKRWNEGESGLQAKARANEPRELQLRMNLVNYN
jgi:hypothetical protein